MQVFGEQRGRSVSGCVGGSTGSTGVWIVCRACVCDLEDALWRGECGPGHLNMLDTQGSGERENPGED
jgi:hypothetical protein